MKCLKKFIFFLTTMLISVNSLLAQVSVSGNVIDQDGQPIPGVTILDLEDNTNGTVTDFDGNFTINSINKLPEYQKLIGGWTISNLDYNYFMVNGNDFLFLDPPYDIKSFLYGNKGDKHKTFDHDEFKNHVDTLTSKFMITYNANQKLIEKYKTYHCLQWDLKYTCLLYTSPSPRDRTRSRMPSSA